MQLANIDLRRLFLLPGSLLLTISALTAAEHACRGSQPLTYGIVHEQAISIKSNVLYNTTFFPISDVAVTILNAPTSLDGITTFRWTQIRTYLDTTDISRTMSAPETTSTAAEDSFVLFAMGSRQHEKRQSGSYWINANGELTNDCTTSPIYVIKNGVLTANLNGTIYTYSTSPGVAYAPLVPNTVPGSITTTFSLSNNQILTWQNPAFFNGQAAFCALSNGTVYAVFQQSAQPDGCLYIQISLFSVSSCQGISLATITGPPGPSGPSGAQGTMGAQGNTGPIGPSGPQGIAGSPGPSGPSGPQGNTGSTGSSGPSGPSGPSGANGAAGGTGPAGITGSAGPSGPTGAVGAVGASGATGPSGATGTIGSVGPSGPSGPSGASGAVGANGAAGVTGSVGPSGPSGAQGAVGPTGATGPTGAIGSTGPAGSTGAVGASGPSGPSGPTGSIGPSGPSGPPGPSASPGILYGYLGCYVQTGSKTSTTGLALSNYQTTYTSYVNSQCSKTCLTAGFIFFGTVNQATTSADCWCGQSISYVSSPGGLLGAGSVTGEAGENNCYACNGGALSGSVPGECGNSSLSTIAIFARSF